MTTNGRMRIPSDPNPVVDGQTVHKVRRKLYTSGVGTEVYTPPNPVERVDRSPLHGYKPPKPKRAYDQGATAVEDTGPIEAVSTETKILWQILGRVDGGPWAHNLVAETPHAATFGGRSHAEGHMKWLRVEAVKNTDAKVEYCLIPIFVSSRRL